MPELRKLFTSLKLNDKSKTDVPARDAGGQGSRQNTISSGSDSIVIPNEPNRDRVNRRTRKKIIASYKDAAAILRQNGYDLKTKNEDALYWACVNGKRESVQLLLCLGTNPDVCYGYRSSLHAAAEYGVCGVVEDLLDRGAHIMARLPSSDTALHSATRKGRYDMVRFLLDRGADIHARGNFGLNALHISARGGFEVIVRMLLEYGADLEATDNIVRTPLHHAAANDQYEIVNQLLALGANSEARDKKKLAPIHLAGEAGHAKSFETLQKVAKGIKQTQRKDGNEVYSSAQGKGRGFREKPTCEAKLRSRDPYKRESRVRGDSLVKSTQQDRQLNVLDEELASIGSLKPLEMKNLDTFIR